MRLLYAILFTIALNPEAEHKMIEMMCPFCALEIPCIDGKHKVWKYEHTCSATLKGVREILQNEELEKELGKWTTNT